MSASNSSPTPQSRSLLDLPPETRNNIYELVLTRADGILRYAPRGGNGPRRDPISADPTSATTPANPEVGSQHTAKVDHFDYNNLQYVCKALRHETHLLELKYNTLCFKSNIPTTDSPLGPAKSATCTFLEFFAAIPAPKRAWIRKVELVSGNPLQGASISLKDHAWVYDSKEVLFQLADLCKDNAALSVKYRLTAFAFDAPIAHPIPVSAVHIVCLGQLYTFLLRHEVNEYLPLLYLSTDWLESRSKFVGDEWGRYVSAKDPQRDVDAKRLRTPNLRFFPKEGLIDEEIFGHDPMPLADGQDSRAFLKQVMQAWMEEGF